MTKRNAFLQSMTKKFGPLVASRKCGPDRLIFKVTSARLKLLHSYLACKAPEGYDTTKRWFQCGNVAILTATKNYIIAIPYTTNREKVFLRSVTRLLGRPSYTEQPGDAIEMHYSRSVLSRVKKCAKRTKAPKGFDPSATWYKTSIAWIAVTDDDIVAIPLSAA